MGTSRFWGFGFIYTTNPVESVNSGIELMRLELGGYFLSLDYLEINLFIQVVNLQDRVVAEAGSYGFGLQLQAKTALYLTL
jgi:hypothetical protein